MGAEGAPSSRVADEGAWEANVEKAVVAAEAHWSRR